MLLSVVIPAYNEELYLPTTLEAIAQASGDASCGVEVIVVDNASTDRTAEYALQAGARVVHEAVHNIARVRNAGAASARGDVLVFIDADTQVPGHFLRRVAEAMGDPSCLGGSPDVQHRVQSSLLTAYLSAWRWFGRRLNLAQGSAQFCRTTVFRTLGSYDESLFMGEDVDFYRRLQLHCTRTGGHLTFLRDVVVLPSPRRFEQTPIWRTLIWTNPLFIAPLRRFPRVWTGWHVRPPR